MNTANKEMKKKDERKKFSQSVKGKNIPANEVTEETGQKQINFNKNDSAVNFTPEGVKQEKILVGHSDYKTDSAMDTSHKFLGINYHEYHIDELQQKARELDLEGRSKMNKEELIKALYETHTRNEIYEAAVKADISGRSEMNKSQLINELRKNTKNTPNTKQNSTSSKSNSNSGSSSGNSSKDTSNSEYYKRTKEELYEVAKKKDIDGRSTMDKDDLLQALYQDHTREEIYEMAKKEDIKGRSSMSKSELIKQLQTV